MKITSPAQLSAPLVLLVWLTSLDANAAATQTRTEGSSPVKLMPLVEIEEDIYRYEPANNGAGPMWCSGSTCLVRIGDDVFASCLETLKDGKPRNNCRWTLFQRERHGWKLLRADEPGRTREPCPLAAL